MINGTARWRAIRCDAGRRCALSGDDAEGQKSNLLRLADAYDALSEEYARCDLLSDAVEWLNAESELILGGVAALE